MRRFGGRQKSPQEVIRTLKEGLQVLNRYDSKDDKRRQKVLSWLVMDALCSRAGHYIFALWFLSSSSFFFFSSPNLSGRRLDVYHTSTHGVALVRI